MYEYYTLYKNSKDPVVIRKELIRYALENGNKATARKFKTTVKTVRKWRKRWDKDKSKGLLDRSKKPNNSPSKMKPYWQFKIADIAKTANEDNKRINGALIKREHNIPYSVKTILKYLKKDYKLPNRRTTTEKKRDMREIKQKYKAFEKIQVDIKYLDDIPEFYFDFKRFKLPKYQITARCIKLGALFIGYTYQKSTTSTAIFIYMLLEHLKKYNIDVREIQIQTDNGTEFTSPWNSLKKTLFTKVIEISFSSKHKTIPIGAKTFQSDVESSHRIIEDEFYAYQYFYSFDDFMQKAYEYQINFNFNRHNKYKGGTPKDLLARASPEISEKILDFKPVIVDYFFDSYKDEFRILAG